MEYFFFANNNNSLEGGIVFDDEGKVRVKKYKTKKSENEQNPRKSNMTFHWGCSISNFQIYITDTVCHCYGHLLSSSWCGNSKRGALRVTGMEHSHLSDHVITLLTYIFFMFFVRHYICCS